MGRTQDNHVNAGGAGLTGCKQKAASIFLFVLLQCLQAYSFLGIGEPLRKTSWIWEVTLRFFNSRSISIRTSNSHPIEDFHTSAWTCSSGNLEEWGAGMVSLHHYVLTPPPPLFFDDCLDSTLTQSSDGVEMGGERKARKVSLDL